jgi:chromosome segregation ATPase
MEFEQLIKRVEWLDEQRRKDKDAIATLEARLANLETSLATIPPQIEEAANEILPLKGLPARLEGYQNTTKKLRKELLTQIEETEQRLAEQQEKSWKNERQRVNRNLSDLKKAVEPITEMQRNIHAISAEGPQLKRSFTQLEKKFEEVVKGSEEALRSTRVTEENRKQDTKRIMDLQGEVSAARKRLEELREKIDLHNESTRRVEIRVNDLLASENDRKQAQAAFIEQQSRLQVQRDQTNKDLKETYEKINKQSEQLQNQLIEWDAIQRAVKRAQEVYEEITQKYERRINEIAEMQRLAEDRFRQEWISFKADDQKRWASFALSNDEQQKDYRVSIEKFNDRLTGLEDLSQTLQDIIQQSQEAQKEYHQGMLTQIHELLEAYGRIIGPSGA